MFLHTCAANEKEITGKHVITCFERFSIKNVNNMAARVSWCETHGEAELTKLNLVTITNVTESVKLFTTSVQSNGKLNKKTMY